MSPFPTVFYTLSENILSFPLNSKFYLSSLVPATIRPVYNLRNTQNFQSIACRTNLYKNSLLPATTNEWNNLPQNVRNAESLSCFKRQINIDRPVPNKLLQFGDRRIQIIHTQLRNNCSSLNQHLFFQNIIDSPLCCCGKIESNKHFFLECGLYNHPRQILRTAISEIAAFNLGTILFGVEDLSFVENKNKFYSSTRIYTGKWTILITHCLITKIKNMLFLCLSLNST